MLGGYQILDLRNIDLSHGTSASNITNAYVLNQLLKLREHIEKSYDFSKALNNQLKPVLIRYRDKKNGEKHESAVFGALQVTNAYYKFKIVAENNGERLIIDVEFEEKTYENDEKYWDIKTAKILLTIDETIGGDASIGGDLDVTGDTSIGGDLDVTGDTSIGGDLDVTGDTSIGGDLDVTGDTSIGGDLEVTGKVNGKIAFEDIEDAQGHKRFIEGEIALKDTLPEGITKVYGKWALSGTHLIIVLCLNGENATELNASTEVADLDVPQWIKDKIYPLFSGISYVETKQITWYGSGWSGQTNLVSLRKVNDNTLNVRFETALSLTADRSCRIAFDLLIDNEEPNP